MNPHTLTTVSEKSRSKRIDIVLWIVARLLHQVASYGIRNINTLNNLKGTIGSPWGHLRSGHVLIVLKYSGSIEGRLNRQRSGKI
jgi:hypothetical protein